MAARFSISGGKRRDLPDWYVGNSMSHADISAAVMVSFAKYYGEQLDCLPPKSLRKLHSLTLRCEATRAFIQSPIE